MTREQSRGLCGLGRQEAARRTCPLGLLFLFKRVLDHLVALLLVRDGRGSGKLGAQLIAHLPEDGEASALQPKGWEGLWRWRRGEKVEVIEGKGAAKESGVVN